jgi:hypothetical protein
MYEVIVHTLSSGRIRRIRFADSAAAWKCADGWNARNRRSKSFQVSVETVTAANQPTAIVAKTPAGRSI